MSFRGFTAAGALSVYEQQLVLMGFTARHALKAGDFASIAARAILGTLTAEKREHRGDTVGSPLKKQASVPVTY